MKPTSYVSPAGVCALVICGLFDTPHGRTQEVATPVDAPHPNIVLMMADDLGWGDTGFQGNTVIKTPHLDEMSRAGLRFTRFYAAAPVCSPTRGSCLTGRHPFRYGVLTANRGHMLPEEITVAELLKRHGYATGHFGKWHLGTLTNSEKDSNRGGPRGAGHFAPPSAHGFDQYFSTEAKVPTWDPMHRPRGNKSNKWWNPVAQPEDAQPYGTAYWSQGKRVTEKLAGDDSRVILDRAIPFIEQAVADKQPFFTVIWFHAPHLPVVAGPKYTAMYAEHDSYAQHYFGCITALDEQVGRLRETLRRLKVADDTLVCFCSDNGPEGRAKAAPGTAGELRGRKRDLFEGGIRVPALAEWPQRIKPGTVSEIPACTSDYLPTILDILGAELGSRRPVDGVTLLPWFAGSKRKRGKNIAFESAGQLALIGDRYKIVHTPPPGKKKVKKNDAQSKSANKLPRFMLFDLVNDPGESHDLAMKQPELVSAMSAELLSWRTNCSKSRQGRDYDPVRE